ncbi:lipoyl synthase [Treponema lecithinolyticum]|uniref:Lipoyl synthase n=1 Tax=Treponema lecithinolyticum ATCC 700332 TaxID=1321815 RepID=A0ABN0NZV5_TRELE|nr:lipoyl synthase [Treponema lecithinolyticum]ERJ93624.1 lipoyl synthase [Treponema lecithinolyticum ATCC 700332]
MDLKNPADLKKPAWLTVKYRSGSLEQVAGLVRNLSLNTVCTEAACPNLAECYKKRTAVFMILGKNCTRNCSFCNVQSGCPSAVDKSEPLRVAQAVQKLNLKYAVITSVTRDDLPDEGAAHFADTIRAVKNICCGTKLEVLIPDMHAKKNNLDTVLNAAPDVLNHNVETVPRLYTAVRPQAVYERSLEVLRYTKSYAAANGIPLVTKTGIMVGLGETEDEVYKVMDDVRSAGCDIITIGQYLRPSKQHIGVAEYIKPEQFETYKKIGMQKGFRYVASGPFVRSSYNAAEALIGTGLLQ